TIPYIGRYGLDSLRDASLWVYAAFAFVIAGLAGDAGLRGAALAYRRYFPWFLAAFPLLAVLFIGFVGWIPLVPGTHGITLLFLKFGDVGVHLAGAGAFLALGLYDRLSERRVPGASWIIWTLFAISAAVVFSLSRSGLVSIVAALGIVLVAKPLGAHWRLVPLGLIGVLLLFAVGQTGVSSRLEREVSVSQIAANVMSIFDSSSRTNQLGDNVRWRLRWWQRIADDTAFGARRLTGRGYGVNLAKVDGFLGDSALDQKLRSPHSVHMTFLARGGLPGLGLWVAFIAVFAAMQIAAYRRASRCGHDVLARVVLFLLAYWVAFLVNASFDVFLEGPQGGIWFWCLTGLAMTAIATVRRETRLDAIR
ncbi:MAG: O-antigen ligase family protein, partial [Myxococcales bacterium]|nr:O-antigen ligase family protein [Myxococcales bacterium]